jgi:hypothetical protein
MILPAPATFEDSSIWEMPAFKFGMLNFRNANRSLACGQAKIFSGSNKIDGISLLAMGPFAKLFYNCSKERARLHRHAARLRDDLNNPFAREAASGVNASSTLALIELVALLAPRRRSRARRGQTEQVQVGSMPTPRKQSTVSKYVIRH